MVKDSGLREMNRWRNQDGSKKTWEEVYGHERAKAMKAKIKSNRTPPQTGTSFAQFWELKQPEQRDREAMEQWVGMTNRIAYRLSNSPFNGSWKQKYAAETRRRVEEYLKRNGMGE